VVSTPLNYMTGEVPARYRGRPYVHERIDGIDHHWVWASGRIHASKGRRVANYGSFVAAAGLRSLSLPRPDVILVSSPPLPVGLLGPVLARRYRAPWLLEVRDIWPESAVAVGWLAEGSSAYRVLDRVARSLAGSAARVVVPTPGLVEHVRAHGAVGVDVVPGPVVDTAPTGHTLRLLALPATFEALVAMLDRMQGDAYGIFLVHYPIVLWLQYWLFDYDLPAIVKAALAFVLAVIFSWGVTAILRKIPGASHVL